jgi:hypothetical protein
MNGSSNCRRLGSLGPDRDALLRLAVDYEDYGQSLSNECLMQMHNERTMLGSEDGIGAPGSSNSGVQPDCFDALRLSPGFESYEAEAA